MLRINMCKTSFLVFALIFAATAKADETADENPPVSVSLGVGAAHVPDYDGSGDYRIRPVSRVNIANINGIGTYLRLTGSHLSSNLIEHPHWRLGLTARYLFDYLDDDDSSLEEVNDERVSLLREPDNALQTGITLGYDFSADPQIQYLLEISATRDVIHGNGGIITPRLLVVRPISPTLIYSTGVSATWASDGYMDNRFGISVADSIRAGLPTFTAKGGIQGAAAEASLTWIASRNWMATVFAHYRRMSGDAANSPIVDERGDTNNPVFGAMVSRTF